MCGRYYRRSDKQRLAEAFHLGELPDGFVLPEDYNVAPSTFQPVIRSSRDTGDPELVLMRWGLVPFFAKTLKDFILNSTINARAEAVATAPLWRTPFERRRCLVPADGYYEWKRLGPKERQPFAFELATHRPFAFAGLWDAWKDPTGAWLQSFSIITTDANPLAARVHSRMPVILQPADYARWLDRSADRTPLDLLRPYNESAMAAHPVDPRVGNVRNNEPGLCTPWQPAPNSA